MLLILVQLVPSCIGWGGGLDQKGISLNLGISWGFIEAELIQMFRTLTIEFEIRPTGFFWDQPTYAMNSCFVSFGLIKFFFLQIWALITLSQISQENLDQVNINYVHKLLSSIHITVKATCQAANLFKIILSRVGGWLDFVVIIPPQPSQAEARLGFWLG